MTEEERQTHYPRPLTALLLTLGAWFAAAFAIALFGREPDVTSVGVGEAFGLGLVATLAARRVPPPQTERLGLLGFEPRFLWVLILLLPAVFLTSELDNIAMSLFATPETEELVRELREKSRAQSQLALVETFIVAVGLAPVVEEWLFRGVIQQGVIAHLGRVRGLLVTALLFALGHVGPTMSAGSGASLFISSLLLGLLLGLVRLASGSLLASILLHAGINAVGLGALALSDAFPIPGFNVEGAHTPWELLLPALLAVYVGGSQVLQSARGAPRVLPIQENTPDGGDSPWGD